MTIPTTGFDPMETELGIRMKTETYHTAFRCINDLPIKESDRKYRWPLGDALMITRD